VKSADVNGGDHVAVRPVVYEDVSLGSGAYPVQQYWLEAKHNGASLTFLNGETRLHFTADSTHPTRTVRLAGQLDLSGSATQLYPVVLIVTAQYTDHTESVVDSLSVPDLLVDNERTSLVARGWTLAGIEHLVTASDGSALITEGDGSALVFRCWSGTSPCTGGYTTPAGEYSTLTVSGSGMLLTYTRMYPDSSSVLFNYLGQMESVRDRFGNAVNYRYDSFGRLTSITDPVRRSHASGTAAVITLTYNSYGLARIIEPSAALGDSALGRATIVTVASDSTLRSIQDPDGHSTQFVYDASRRLAKIISRRGDTTTFAYNATSWKLDSLLSPRVPIDAGGGTTTLQSPVVRYGPWQTVGVPTGTTASVPFVPVAPDSVVARVTDPEGHLTTYTVDRWGQPLVTTDALGRVTTISRSGPLPVRVVYPSGAKDSAAYNGQGLMTYSAPAGQNPSTITYGAYALPTQITGSSQPTETFKYGLHGRDSLATVAGLTTHYYADMFGRDTAVTDPGGHIYKLHYGGPFGNLDSTLAAGTGQPVQYTRTTFDGYGRDSIQMASGSVGDTTVYDSTNRVVRVAAAGHHVVIAAYDPLFRTTVTDAKGQVYRDSINALGWRVQRTDPTGAVTKYRYNRDGLLTSTTNRRRQIVARSYDALHRLLADNVSSTVADSFAYNTTGTVQVGWNAVSRDSAFTNAVTGWTDSVVTRFATGAGSERFRRYYRPTALQQLDSLGLTSPSTITLTGRRYFWNTATGQLDSIKVGSNRFRMQYNAEGLPDTLTYPGGVKEGTLYSSVHLPIRVSFTQMALDTVLSRSYRYDSLGQMLEADGKTRNGANELMHVYTYDPLGQLSVAQLLTLNNDTTCVTNGDFGLQCIDSTYALTEQANSFQYDSVGNLRTDFDSSSMSTTTGTYTSGDRQSAWGATHYTYDADGNRLTRVTGSDTVHFYWSPEGLMDSVRAGGATISYAYNASGQLVRRSGHGVKRYFLWDQGQLLAELDSTATHRVGEYAYAPGTDAPIALVTGSGTVQQVVQDVNGNVIGLFTGSSTITERETYAPWGALEAGALTTLADTNRLRWKGLVWEGDSTQLYYVRARWYDPVSRRFVSEDPLGVDAGINPYEYGGNNAVSNRDANGMYFTTDDCDDEWWNCADGGDSFVGGGVGSFPGDQAYTCDVQLLGALACLEQANDFLLNSVSLTNGWSAEPYRSGCGSNRNSESISVPVYAGDMWLLVPTCVPLSAPRGFCGYGCDKVGPVPPIDPSSNSFFTNSDSWFCDYGCGKGDKNPYAAPMSKCARTGTVVVAGTVLVATGIGALYGFGVEGTAVTAAATTGTGEGIHCSLQ